MQHIFTLTLFLFTTLGFAQQTTDPVLANVTEDGAESINWISMEEGLKAMEGGDKKLFIDFYTDWCGWCKVQDRTTFKDPEVIKLINENFVAVKFNGEHKDPITMDGQEFKYVASGRRGYHELAAYFLQNKLSYPTVLLVNERKEIYALPGYRKADALSPILAYYGMDFYQDASIDWEEFTANYKTYIEKGN